MFQNIISKLIQKEKYFFLFTLLVNIWFVFYNKFYTSMDGAAHLHNAYLLKQLLSGSNFIEQFFVINTIPIPNWTNHLVLSSLLSILPPNIAEKGTCIIYIVLTSLSFRYLIKQLQPKNIIGSFLIFPFLFTFLFHLGFINFCYSIGFMFLGLGYFLKHKNQINYKNGFVLALIVLLTYFSNVIGFIYLLYFLFSFCIINQFRENSQLNKQAIFQLIKKCLFLLVISIVPIICLLVFYRSIIFYPSDFFYKKEILMDWIFDIRPLIIYIYDEDKKYTQILFLLLTSAFSIAIYKFYIQEKVFKFSENIASLLSILFTTLLLFKIKDGSSAGMMSDRLCLILFILFLITLLAFPIPKPVLYVISTFSVFINFSLFYYNHKNIMKNYSEHADKMYSISNHINSKSIVLPINMEADWMEGHFSNYIGVDKEIVVLENYEANVGWFPLKWKKDNLPKFIIGSKQTIANINWITNPESKTEKKIDYILLFGNTTKLDMPEYAELKTELMSFYIKDESINDSYIQLFKTK